MDMKMNSQSNCFENLINSFKLMCTALEREAELNLRQIEEEYGKELSSCVKSLQQFNEIVLGISETCSELVNSNEILKHITRKNLRENSINLPYEMHPRVIKSMNELYNMTPIGKENSEEKLINEKNKQLVNDLVKVGEKNCYEIKDIENTVLEANKYFKHDHFEERKFCAEKLNDKDA